MFHEGPPGPSFNITDAPRPPLKPGGGSFLMEISHHIFLFLVVVFFSLILRIGARWKQTEKEKLNTELSYLKAQINPHFLFNTLNSIYSLAIEKSDYTASAIVQLSGMMRYVLSESHNDFVPLEKEIIYLNNYIELQRIRFGNSIKLVFAVNGSAAFKKIAPLVLIPFVENAFKYGVNAEEDSDINIQVDIGEENLHLQVFNKKVRVLQATDDKSGLGIENTKKRLQLLYPDYHRLLIHDNENDYFISLTLQLK